jgi:hypothetical protein
VANLLNVADPPSIGRLPVKLPVIHPVNLDDMNRNAFRAARILIPSVLALVAVASAQAPPAPDASAGVISFACDRHLFALRENDAGLSPKQNQSTGAQHRCNHDRP